MFSSGGGFEPENNLLDPIHKKVHKNFVPINYYLLGFDRIKLEKNRKFHLHIEIDSDFIFSARSDSEIEFIRLIYLTIGQKTDNICNECNNFIFNENCIDQCPSSTYPFLGYTNGGKSCLSCSVKMNEKINA